MVLLLDISIWVEKYCIHVYSWNISILVMILCDIQATQRAMVYGWNFREIMIKDNLLGHHAHKCNTDGKIHGF